MFMYVPMYSDWYKYLENSCVSLVLEVWEEVVWRSMPPSHLHTSSGGLPSITGLGSSVATVLNLQRVCSKRKFYNIAKHY